MVEGMQTDWESLEKRTCDNCNVEVVGRFCPLCGQNDKNYEGSLWRVIGDILREQFDFHSRATQTIKALFLKPGLLAVEFRSNRRASYVAPIRMYLFSSLLFFFLIVLAPNPREGRDYWSSFDTESHSWDSEDIETEESIPPSVGGDEESELQIGADQLELEELTEEFESARERLDGKTNQLISEILTRPSDSPSKNLLVGHLLAISEKETLDDLDSWFTPLLVKVLYDFSRLVEDFKNNLALIMVILFPWMVLTSSLLNRGKHIRIVHQLVFWMHVFTFVFLLLSLEQLLVSFVLKQFAFAGLVTLLTFLLLIGHTYWAYHKFYGGGHISGILKFLLLMIMYGVGLLVSLVGVVALSIYNL